VVGCGHLLRGLLSAGARGACRPGSADIVPRPSSQAQGWGAPVQTVTARHPEAAELRSGAAAGVGSRVGAGEHQLPSRLGAPPRRRGRGCCRAPRARRHPPPVDGGRATTRRPAAARAHRLTSRMRCRQRWTAPAGTTPRSDSQAPARTPTAGRNDDPDAPQLLTRAHAVAESRLV
jgi:hypothetical protein